jgi:two-component system sensor kinase FixL
MKPTRPDISHSNNPISAEVTGYDRQELLGTHYLSLVHADYRDDTKEFYRRQYIDRVPSTYHEFPLVTASRETVWLGQNVQLIERDGKVEAYHAVARDITERKRVEAALKESEARVRAVLDSSHDPIVTIDTHGIIESVNPATEETFGYSREELVDQGVETLMPEPHRSQHASYICNYLRTGNPKVIGTGREVTAVRKDGTVFPLELSIGEIRLEGKRLFTGIMRDITERKVAEKKIEKPWRRPRPTGMHCWRPSINCASVRWSWTRTDGSSS